MKVEVHHYKKHPHRVHITIEEKGKPVFGMSFEYNPDEMKGDRVLVNNRRMARISIINYKDALTDEALIENTIKRYFDEEGELP